MVSQISGLANYFKNSLSNEYVAVSSRTFATRVKNSLLKKFNFFFVFILFKPKFIDIVTFGVLDYNNNIVYIFFTIHRKHDIARIPANSRLHRPHTPDQGFRSLSQPAVPLRCQTGSRTDTARERQTERNTPRRHQYQSDTQRPRQEVFILELGIAYRQEDVLW